MHTANGERCTRIDSSHFGVRVRAAYERRVQHSGQMEIVDVAAFAAQQLGIFLAPDGSAETGVHQTPFRMRFAAANAASTMP
jgi:hypothetical protein